MKELELLKGNRLCFFFQEEDGIRFRNVTGVQTCALPIWLAETTTVLKGETAEQGVRTIVCREIVPGPKKDRWHPLFTTALTLPEDVLRMYRTRQYHEQAYRVGVHDEQLDAVPCGYDKESPDPKRPRFHRGPLQMMGWLVALVYNAVGDWAPRLA